MTPDKFGEWVLVSFFALCVVAVCFGASFFAYKLAMVLLTAPEPRVERCADGEPVVHFRPGDPKRHPFICSDGRVFL